MGEVTALWYRKDKWTILFLLFHNILQDYGNDPLKHKYIYIKTVFSSNLIKILLLRQTPVCFLSLKELHMLYN